jgi:hypothetical protein
MSFPCVRANVQHSLSLMSFPCVCARMNVHVQHSQCARASLARAASARAFSLSLSLSLGPSPENTGTFGNGVEPGAHTLKSQ